MADEVIKVKSSDIEKLIEWLRRGGQPQSLEEMSRRLVEIIREEATSKGR